MYVHHDNTLIKSVYVHRDNTLIKNVYVRNIFLQVYKNISARKAQTPIDRDNTPRTLRAPFLLRGTFNSQRELLSLIPIQIDESAK